MKLSDINYNLSGYNVFVKFCEFSWKKSIFLTRAAQRFESASIKSCKNKM